MKVIETKKYAQSMSQDVQGAMAAELAMRIFKGGNRNQILMGVNPSLIPIVNKKIQELQANRVQPQQVQQQQVQQQQQSQPGQVQQSQVQPQKIVV